MNSRSFANLNRRRAGEHGVTLVELLVTLTIIGILASAFMFALAGATEAAKRAKTRAMVVKLHTLLIERWESYRTRRVRISTAGLNLADLSANSIRDPRVSQVLELIGKRKRMPFPIDALYTVALREVMKTEMPDRWTDITGEPIVLRNFDAGRSRLGPPPMPTALAVAYRRRYLSNLDPRTNSTNPPDENFEGAECLYLIITMATGDGDALSQFSETDIGDADADGAPEFLDGWGNPIGFIRWPAGFVSEVQPLVNGMRDPVGDHDPFDAFHRHQEAYRTLPLIYSWGADEQSDISVSKGASVGLNPFMPPNGANLLTGSPFDKDGDGEEWHDNIHNHLIGLR